MEGPLGELEGDSPEVDIIWWPDEAERRAVSSAWTPRLLFIAPDADPPAELGELEDWLRLPLDPDELAERRAALLRRAARGRPLSVDDDGLVQRGTDWVALPERELAMLRALLTHMGKVVSHAELLAAIHALGVATSPHSLNRHVQRLRQLVAPLGLEIQTIRAAGYLLEVT